MSNQTWTLPQSDTPVRAKTTLLMSLLGGIFCVLLLTLVSSFGIKVIPIVLFAAGLIWMVFSDPFYGLLLVFLMIFSGAAAGFELPGGYMAVAAFASLAWIFDRTRKCDLTFQYGKQQGIFIALLFATLLMSIPFSFNREVSFLKLIGYVKVIILYLLIVNTLKTEKQLKLSLAAIFVLLVISFGYGLYNLLFAVKELQAVDISGKTIDRIQGLTYDPNLYASSILIFMPIPFLFFFEEGKFFSKLTYIGLFGLLTASIAITFSRGGLVSLGFMMIIFMFKKRHERFVLWTGIIAIFAIIILLPPDFWERFSFISNLRNESSANWRYKLAVNALNYFLSHPIFGIGLGNYIQESNRFVPHHQVAHNMYIETAAETGIFGILAFLGLIWITIRYYEQSRLLFTLYGKTYLARLTEALKIGFYGFLFSALFLSLQMDTLLWAQFGFAGALRLMAEHQGKFD